MTIEKSKVTEEAKKSLIEQGNNEEAIDAYIELELGDDDLSDFEDAYIGQFDSDEEFARDFAEQTGDMPKDMHWPMYCIDWEWAARELMNDYYESNGYYFRAF